jgi:hypothetical protein
VYTFSGQFSAPVPLSATSRDNVLADLLLGYPSSCTVQITRLIDVSADVTDSMSAAPALPSVPELDCKHGECSIVSR